MTASFSLRVWACLAVLALPMPALAQDADGEAILRVERLENQLRHMTGAIEQLQFRNQQLEQQLKRLQEDIEFRLQQGGQATARPGQPAAPHPASPPAAAAPAPVAPAPAMQPAPVTQPAPGRRSDAFDPAGHPGAPGAPRGLGTGGPVAEPDVGAPGGRASGDPLDLAHLTPQNVPPAGQPAPQGTPALATAPPAGSPRDEFDLGYGYVLRRDYALAEQTLRGFLQKYPGDPQVADAQYWLGESLFQRRQYREAAESFLAVTTKFAQAPKAPDSLLRLGQSLAALKEKEAACATLGEVGRKYPRASANVKQGVGREQKRLGC
ncbi:MAG: tol-pal system protein YbgF [Xanthobacteraceae bacterium]|nr:MAG: tol-pal system protein YbgF [Xanthobacteraceae bacterium]